MIECRCPHCENELAAPDNYAGWVAKCSKCGRKITLPSAPTDGVPQPVYATAGDAKEKAAFERRYRGPRKPSWFWGVLAPLLIVGVAIWFGFVEQDIPAPMKSRTGPGWDAEGQAAVWAGLSYISMALLFHCYAFWLPKKRNAATWVGIVAVVALFATFFMAAIEQDKVDETKQERRQQQYDAIQRQLDSMQRKR